MSDKCLMTRDLIPLVIDGAASQESINFVKEHIKGCASCRSVYEEMSHVSVPKQSQSEKRLMEKAVSDLRAKRKRKKRILILCSAVVGILLFLFIARAVTFFCWEFNRAMDTQDYKLFLHRMSDDSVVVSYEFLTESYSTDFIINASVDGSIMTITARRPIVQLSQAKMPEKGISMRILSDMMSQCTEIRYGTLSNYDVVWREGSVIPAASPEMEEYFRLCDQMEELQSSLPDSDGKFFPNEAYVEMEDKLEGLSVPEWEEDSLIE